MFIILTGSSGVGKNTVITKMEKDNENIKLMPTYTTRQKRPNEVEGYPFYYLTTNEFQEKIKNGELIEYEHIHGNFYGSSYKILDEILKLNVTIMKDFGIEGAQNLTNKISHITPVIKVFLTTSKRELVKRLKGRGEKQIKLRLKRYKREQSEINKFDYIIYNNDLEKTCEFIDKLSKISINDFLPTIKVNKINTKKVNKAVEKLQKGEFLPSIKVSFVDDKLYIIKGIESFIASVLTNKLVAKTIVENKKINKLSDEEYKKFSILIQQSTEC